jgi:protein-S-isoprenylcysteine O-methyltransferase Ste14
MQNMDKAFVGKGDLLGRMGIIGYFAFVTYKLLETMMHRVGLLMAGDPAASISDLMTSIANLAFLILVIATTAIRLKPIDAAEGIQPRVVALAGTFASIFIMSFTPTFSSPILQTTGFLFTFCGLSLSAYVLFWLGRSFSILAEARRLVVAGPYKIVRHPLYVVEEIAIIGIVMMNFSVAAVLCVCVQWCLQMMRMRNEEKVLTRAFPEYVEYAQRTPRVIPTFLFPRMVPRNTVDEAV